MKVMRAKSEKGVAKLGYYVAWEIFCGTV